MSENDLSKGADIKLQDKIIRNFSKRHLNMIKELPELEASLFELVNSFGNISQKYLCDYSTDKEPKFYKVLRLELTESTGCLNNTSEKLFKSLIREHIFVDGGRSPPWGKGISNLKLILRPIYTPALRISYNDRYSIKTNCNQLKQFLTKPKEFEKAATKFLKNHTKQKTLSLDDFTVALHEDSEDENYD